MLWIASKIHFGQFSRLDNKYLFCYNTKMTDQEIIEIRKATKPADVTKPWGDTLAFARAIIEAYKKTQK
jgi:hypothetical protein